MRVLVACELSGVVREAFRSRGHDAWSCDLFPSRDMTHHFYTSITNPRVWFREWDLMIAHPPCTHLASSGARWFKTRLAAQGEAVQFFLHLANMSVPRIAIENPIGVMSTYYCKPDQIIQPWMFGHPETKATCLWLKGLPKLVPTNIVEGREPRVHYESPGVKNGMTRQQRRSITLQGIAEAMADQWGNLP